MFLCRNIFSKFPGYVSRNRIESHMVALDLVFNSLDSTELLTDWPQHCVASLSEI